MNLIVNLQVYQRSKLFAWVKNTHDMLSVCLSSIEYLQYWQGNPKTPRRPYMLIDIDDTQRIFLIDVDKIISFSFPLNIKIKDADVCDPQNVITGFYLRRHLITAREISEAKQILSNCSEVDSLYCYNVIEEDSVISEKTLFLFEHLLFSEWGYLRFDHDPSHAIEGMHPENHFDINFTRAISYKIGLTKCWDIKEIMNMIKKDVPCATLEYKI